MNFNSHFRLEGQHAFLSASKYHWINYDDEKLINVFTRAQAIQRGTELHELAHNLIRLGVKLPKTNKTLNMYVNDAIGFKMTTEQILYYSDNCFGTADAISFKKGFLRIHDLKSGDSPASIKQLMIYTALFCLEYGHKPIDLQIELRLYQADEATPYIPDPQDISHIMERIIISDKIIEETKALGG